MIENEQKNKNESAEEKEKEKEEKRNKKHKSKYLKEKIFVLEECLQLYEQFEARTYVQNQQIIRVKIILGECFREGGSPEKARYLLGNVLFKLRVSEERELGRARCVYYVY